jgi:hypothetical protein
VGKITKEDLMHLEVENKESSVILNGMPLKYVKEYKIESPALLPGTAELSIKIWVKYP